jgi:hypothetical protein
MGIGRPTDAPWPAGAATRPRQNNAHVKHRVARMPTLLPRRRRRAAPASRVAMNSVALPPQRAVYVPRIGVPSNKSRREGDSSNQKSAPDARSVALFPLGGVKRWVQQLSPSRAATRDRTDAYAPTTSLRRSVAKRRLNQHDLPVVRVGSEAVRLCRRGMIQRADVKRFTPTRLGHPHPAPRRRARPDGGTREQPPPEERAAAQTLDRGHSCRSSPRSATSRSSSAGRRTSMTASCSCSRPGPSPHKSSLSRCGSHDGKRSLAPPSWRH